MFSSFQFERRHAFCALACAVALFVAGCDDTEIHANAPVKQAPAPVAFSHPMSVAPDTLASPPAREAVAPPAPPVFDSDELAIAIPSSKPPAPHKPPEAPVAEAENSHPSAPQIAPQLSQVDQAAYQRKTLDQISTAERNLLRANGKQLNAAQQDLVEKIRSFLGQSRDASKDGDWIRAQNLAQKAQLLSAELINSL